MSRDIITINDQTFNNLPVWEITPLWTVVDGQGTERMSTVGNRLFRDVENASGFYNLRVIMGGQFQSAKDEQWQMLIRLLMSYSSVDFYPVGFNLPDGTWLTQNMYCTSANFNMPLVDRFGETYWKPLTLSFIAEVGRKYERVSRF